MSDWTEWIGTAANLQQKTVAEAFGKMYKYALLARRKGIHDTLTDELGDEYKDPYFRFETLEQLNDPKSKDDDPPYYTYEFEELVPVKKDGKVVKVKDSETGKMVTKKEKDAGPHKVKNFVTVGGDVKLFIQFLFCKYMDEAFQCYQHEKKSFNEPDQVLSQIRAYLDNHYGMLSISNFIVDVVDSVPVDQFVDNDEIPNVTKNESLEEYLIKQAKATFKNDHGHSPNIQLKTIISKFIGFIQLIAVMHMDLIWGNPPGTLHIKDVLGIIRQLYVVRRSDGHEYQHGVYSSAEQWVEDCVNNAKKLREENAKKEKKAPAKKGAKKDTKKKTPAKKNKKKKDASEDDEEEENGSEVDDAMDELEDEENKSREDVDYEDNQDFDE